MWYTHLTSTVQIILAVLGFFAIVVGLLVLYKSRFRIKDGDKELVKEAPTDEDENEKKPE